MPSELFLTLYVVDVHLGLISPLNLLPNLYIMNSLFSASRAYISHITILLRQNGFINTCRRFLLHPFLNHFGTKIKSPNAMSLSPGRLPYIPSCRRFSHDPNFEHSCLPLILNKHALLCWSHRLLFWRVHTYCATFITVFDYGRLYGLIIHHHPTWPRLTPHQYLPSLCFFIAGYLDLILQAFLSFDLTFPVRLTFASVLLPGL